MRFLQGIADIVKEAGKIMTAATDIEHKQSEKSGDYNIVTKYDVAVQQYLFSRLSELVPGAQFIGEESMEETPDIRSGYTFVIDPIDGTTNFVHGFMQSAVSVGLLKDGAMLCGVVYNPYTEELFTAERGKGAYLNGVPIRASADPITKTMVGFGTSPYHRSALSEPTFRMLKLLFPHCQDLRRTGSAALDICYVACARLGLFFELVLCPWDYTAASLILDEAGGVITTLDYQPIRYDRPVSILAAGKRAYEDYQEIVAKA